jgi:hypothetical protein
MQKLTGFHWRASYIYSFKAVFKSTNIEIFDTVISGRELHQGRKMGRDM